VTPARANPASAAADGSTLAPDDPSVLVGRVIAERYRVDAVLGIGGMGAVLRCHHLGLRRDVAVKLLHPELAGDREIAARFEREAASASRLDHPNCVRVLDFGAWEPVPGMPPAKYLAMQLLEGQELTEMLGQPLAARRALGLIQQILTGLEHAHAHGVVHRDLKPENVFVTRDHDGGELLKLVDFGIAKISEGEDAGPKLTRLGVVFGTPLYMSPEQAAGGVVDVRTDLYAAGVILFEMLAGVPPFTGSDATTLLRKHVFEDPPTLSDAVPPALRGVVARLLAKDRDQRFASAREVRDVLAVIEQALPITSGSVGETAGHIATTMPPGAFTMPLAPGLPSASRRHAGFVLGAVALALGLAVWAWPRSDDTPADDGSQRPGLLTALNDAATPVVAPPAAAVASARADVASAVGAMLGPVAASAAGVLPLPRVPAATLEIDAALARGETTVALAKIDTALVSTPDSAPLHLRRGRALATVDGRDHDALAAFADALQQDGAVLDDLGAQADLFGLLRRPALRPRAAEFAIESLDARGVPLLVEFVHAPTPVLDYVLRHRALARIERDDEQRAGIDTGLQYALDLWQAPQAPTPCVAFAAALDGIARAPSADVLGTLHRVTPPPVAADADPEIAAMCATLPMRLQAVRTAVLAAHPVRAERWTVPPAYAVAKKKKPKRRSGLRRLFGG